MSKKLKKIKELVLPKQETFKRKTLQPKTNGQKNLIDTICSNQITICLGPAGTGKGHISVGYAVNRLITQQCKKIILSRPIIPGGGESIGHLPGDSDSKILPYLQPLLDEFRKFASAVEIAEWKNHKIIEFVPLAHCRGRTFDDCVVIIDELQNANYEQMKMVLTRLGQNCKLILIGDTEQSDLYKQYQGALLECYKSLIDIPEIGLIRLNDSDIVRNALIGTILNRLKQSEYENKKTNK